MVCSVTCICFGCTYGMFLRRLPSINFIHITWHFCYIILYHPSNYCNFVISIMHTYTWNIHSHQSTDKRLSHTNVTFHERECTGFHIGHTSIFRWKLWNKKCDLYMHKRSEFLTNFLLLQKIYTTLEADTCLQQFMNKIWACGRPTFFSSSCWCLICSFSSSLLNCCSSDSYSLSSSCLWFSISILHRSSSCT